MKDLNKEYFVSQKVGTNGFKKRKLIKLNWIWSLGLKTREKSLFFCSTTKGGGGVF